MFLIHSIHVMSSSPYFRIRPTAILYVQEQSQYSQLTCVNTYFQEISGNKQKNLGHKKDELESVSLIRRF